MSQTDNLDPSIEKRKRIRTPDLPTVRLVENRIKEERVEPEERIAGLLEAFSMIPSPAEVPLAMGAAALRSKDRGETGLGMLGSALLAGSIEALPFDEAFKVPGRALGKMAREIFEKLSKSKTTKNLTEDKIQKLVADIVSPEDVPEVMRKAGIPEEIIDIQMGGDIVGNYQNKLAITTDPEYLEFYSKKSGIPIEELKQIPTRILREDTASTLRGAKLGLVQEAGEDRAWVEMFKETLPEGTLEDTFKRKTAKDLTEEEIVDIAENLTDPEDLTPMLVELGLDPELASMTRQDLVNNYKVMKQIADRPGAPTEMKKEPARFLKRKARGLLRGLKEGSFRDVAGRPQIMEIGD